MFETKMLEIRDTATYIPVLAIKMVPTESSSVEEAGIDAYHLRNTGYDLDYPLIVLVRLDPIGARYDAHDWDVEAVRTMREAHMYINKHFDELKYGDVVDVEYILGLKPTLKTSQRFRT